MSYIDVSIEMVLRR